MGKHEKNGGPSRGGTGIIALCGGLMKVLTEERQTKMYSLVARGK